MTPLLTVGQTEIPYEVRYSARATRKRIVVTPGRVEVVAPAGTPLEGSDSVLDYVHRKRRWVFDAVREIEAKHRRLLTQRFASGAKLQYRGRWLMLDVRAGDTEAVEVACRSRFHVTVPRGLDGVERLEAVRAALHGWLRERALRDARRFGRRHEVALGVRAAGVRLSDAKRRWGSLGRDGVVRVHWRLAQAPAPAMDYVVAHEVAHLLHRHHGPEFWAAVARALPDWRERKAMLEAWEQDHRAV
ncbi:MAG: SprT family zinc-dependent metalloprotease [Bacteroidota bacterium]